MNLVELVKLKNTIDATFEPGREIHLIDNILLPTYDLITNTASQLMLEQWKLVIPELEKTKQQWKHSLAQYHKQIQQIAVNLDQLIHQQWPEMFAKSASEFASGTQVESIDTLPLTAESQKFVDGRIKLLGDWRRPGLIIRPGYEPWMRAWVSYDPLYLADTEQRFLDPAVTQWNPAYQSRLRTYVVREPNRPVGQASSTGSVYANRTVKHLLENLPHNQFDGCLVYNFFHYKNAELIDLYLKSITQILTPGGKLLCTINDCDKWAGVQQAVNGAASFVPKSWFVDLADSYGLRLSFCYDLAPHLTWIELEKPGSIRPLRAGQTMAKILNKSPEHYIVTAVDRERNSSYTKPEIEHLIEAAINLNIDTAYNCRYNYTPRQLAKLIKRRMKKS